MTNSYLKHYLLDFKTLLMTVYVIGKYFFSISVFLLVAIVFFQDKAFFIRNMKLYFIILVALTIACVFLCYLLHYLKMKRKMAFEDYRHLSTVEKANSIASVLRLN